MERIRRTNADRIRSMTDEELAEMLCAMTYCQECPHQNLCDSQRHAFGYKMWLMQDSEVAPNG